MKRNPAGLLALLAVLPALAPAANDRAAKPAGAGPAATGPAATRPAGPSLLSNGGFEATAKSADWPDDWPRPDGASWETEGGNHFLRLRPTKPGQTITLFRTVPVRPEQKALAFTCRVRYADVQRGKENWHDARILLDFKDAEGKKLKGSPPAMSFKGTSDGWVDRRVEFLVPEGAVTLDVMPALFLVQSGTLDLDDLSLTAVPPEPLAAAREAAAAKEAARIAALPKPKPQVPVPPADKLPKPLHVDGNRLMASDGQPVWLQGLAIPSLEWSGKGDYVIKSVGVALADWKANCIRLPIRDDFWAGHGPYQSDGGMGYRQTVDDVVNACGGAGAYVVLDLHRFRAPTEEHVAFWRDVAAKYKDHPAVLFELFNEPHDVPWDVWRNGGTVTDRKAGAADTAAENKEKLTTFTAVGMQQLLDAVRGTGAANVVIAGGLDWGYDLSGVLTGSALEDKTGHGVVYSSHVYPWKGDWRGKFLAAAEKYPIFVGECGGEVERPAFIPPERHEDPYTWCPDMLGVIQKHKLNWTAWCFHPKATPRVISDWDYTPTPFWGAFVKRALAGEAFEAKRLR